MSPEEEQLKQKILQLLITMYRLQKEEGQVGDPLRIFYKLKEDGHPMTVEEFRTTCAYGVSCGFLEEIKSTSPYSHVMTEKGRNHIGLQAL